MVYIKMYELIHEFHIYYFNQNQPFKIIHQHYLLQQNIIYFNIVPLIF